jgi:hypothetical protein
MTRRAPGGYGQAYLAGHSSDQIRIGRDRAGGRAPSSLSWALRWPTALSPVNCEPRRLSLRQVCTPQQRTPEAGIRAKAADHHPRPEGGTERLPAIGDGRNPDCRVILTTLYGEA